MAGDARGLTPEQWDEVRETFRRLTEATRGAADSIREFAQNAADAGLADLAGDDWESSARRRTDDNLRDVFS